MCAAVIYNFSKISMFTKQKLWMASSLSGLNEPRVSSSAFYFYLSTGARSPCRTIAHAVISSLFAHAREGSKSRFDNSSENVGHANEIKCWTSLVLVCASKWVYINTLSHVLRFFSSSARPQTWFSAPDQVAAWPLTQNKHISRHGSTSVERSPGIFRCSEAFVLTRPPIIGVY